MTGDTHDLVYTPSQGWLDANDQVRIEKVSDFFNRNASNLTVSVEGAQDNGHVIVRIEDNIPASERGLFLLDLEQKLKNEIDKGLTLWLEPVGDKSKLRQLRGVTVKS